MVKQAQNKSVTIDDIDAKAYGNPTYAGIRLIGTTICPKCNSEIAQVIQDHGSYRILVCSSCGTQYRTKDFIA